MRLFALAVFGLHALAELAFGTNAFLSGVFSSQTAEQLANQPANIASSARFLGAALFSLGLLGALTIFIIGVASQAGRVIAIVLAIFHGVGVAGLFVTNGAYPGFIGETHALGAMTIHGALALGFLVVATLHNRIST